MSGQLLFLQCDRVMQSRWSLRGLFCTVLVFACAGVARADILFQGGPGAHIVSEGAGGVTLTMARAGGALEVVWVEFYTVAGSATPDVDYVSTNGLLAFQPDDTNKTVFIPVLDDAV